MNLNKHLLWTAAAALMATLCGQARADWAQAATPLEIKTLPANLAAQAQNPPTFSWSRYSTSPPSYTIELYLNGVLQTTYTSTRNWYMPSHALPVGTYSWRVTPTTVVDWSTMRSFTINANSQTYEVPENADLRARILTRARPRALQPLPLYSTWSGGLLTERGPAVTALIKEVQYQIVYLPIISDTQWTLDTSTMITAAQAAQVADIRNKLGKQTRQLEAAALLYRITGSQQFLTEALRRGDELAAFDPLGPTNYYQQDQAPFAIASALIRAYDCVSDVIDPTRKAAWLASVTAYTNQIYGDLSQYNGRIDQYPFDSHAISNTAGVALISTLAVGDIPDAVKWFDFAFRSYVSSLSVWSGPEGGFANGTAYGEFAVDLYMQVWQPALQAMGLDLYSKPWSRGFLNFFMYFVPPGQTSHVFGDGHEVKPTSQVMKAYASNFATPAAAWYVNSLPGSYDNLTLLRSPYPLPSSSVVAAAPTVNAFMLPTIGWGAMHSKLSDPLRTSVYFKSSSYGSYNHSHGDQNSLVVMSAGYPMLAEGGWYDYYGSPMWTSWYRTTKAHNALTFDGGLGQTVTGGNLSIINATGRINAFSTTSAQDYIEGDATPSYGGQLSSAVRKVWYLRTQDAVVVQDLAKSANVHKYEWNFHTFGTLTYDATTMKSSIAYQGRTLCLRPIVKTGLLFNTVANLPQMTGRTESQGVYSFGTAATAGEFLMLIDPGCKNPTVTLTTTSTGRTLTVGSQTITLPK